MCPPQPASHNTLSQSRLNRITAQPVAAPGREQAGSPKTVGQKKNCQECAKGRPGPVLQSGALALYRLGGKGYQLLCKPVGCIHTGWFMFLS